MIYMWRGFEEIGLSHALRISRYVLRRKAIVKVSCGFKSTENSYRELKFPFE